MAWPAYAPGMGTASYCCSPTATGACSLTIGAVGTSGTDVDGDELGNINPPFGVTGVAGLALLGGAWSLKPPSLGVK